ncbi:hypothetical protein PMI14_04341 [Acidovorax sp. CF316]|uniref:hypothetical protein n=1 Tax=Acidovorax sp. CF316 TaxID=1144317 RepID=UPI00026BE7BB|nr:hypothetical protein [Acidovorax sp. CF316]EJE51010.1 hypothetical protein PMI14_04341 [Acidovorax sp. CF316]
MKFHHLPPRMRAVAAFVVTVVLAFLAAAALLMPDIMVQSVDSMVRLPGGVEQILTQGFSQ